MARRRLSSALLLFSAVLALIMGALAPAGAVDGDLPIRQIHVTVLDQDTSEPLPDIEVALFLWFGEGWVDSGHHFTTSDTGEVAFGFSTSEERDLTFRFTDPSGAYATSYGDGSLTDLPEGSTGPGVFHYGTDQTPFEETVGLTRAPEQQPTFAITGYVSGAESGYLDGISVEAVDATDPEAAPAASAITYEGPEHAHGYYRLQVPDGDYVVRFAPMEPGTYRPVTYPTTVQVAGGDVTLDEVTLPLMTQPVARGSVTSGSGPIASPRVVVYRWSGDGWTAEDSYIGDADGGFTVPVPAQSTITVKVSAPGHVASFLGGGATLPDTPSASNSREVGDDDVDLGAFELAARGSDLGRVAGQVLPYCTTNTLPANDDDSTAAIAIPFPLTFFGEQYTQLYVNNNGNITFNDALSDFTPESLETDTEIPIIAPFFADVDTRAEGSSEVTYGASEDGNSFCVNWADVGYYGHHDDKLNTFQLILTRNSTGEGRVAGDFDITMNYDRVEWETGDASHGSDGYGGTSAAAGFSAGTGVPGTFVQLPGSLENGALLDGAPDALTSHFQGSIQRGRYVFQIRNSGIAVTLGDLHGTVVDTSDAPVGGAYVQACRESGGGGGTYCRTTLTNEAGAYAFTALRVGDYDLSVSPNSASQLFPGSGSATVMAGADQLADPIVLQAPQPMPRGVVLSNDDEDSGLIEPYVGADGVPVIHYMADIDFSFDGCPEVPSPTYTQTVGGVQVRTAELLEDPTRPGHYSATIPSTYPLHGDGSITTNVPATCDVGAQPVGFDVYIDPSGVVTDQYGRALDGASVELQRADAGTGPFVPVPDGSPVMSPANRTNPDTTDAAGFFQWDVLTGWYQVKASHAGCTDTTTNPMEVPPARLDLLIKMTCAAAPMPTPTSVPVLSGTPQVGQQLTVSQGGWGPVLSFERIEWRRGNTVVGTGPSYLVASADQGSQITARVYAKRPDYRQENGVGDTVTFASASYDVTSAAVPALPGGGGGGGASAPVTTAPPTVSGVAKVGQTLTAHPGTWNTSGLSFSYQWKRAGQIVAGATTSEYTATAADLDKALSVTVTASKPGVPNGVATSEPVTVVLGDAPQALAPPVISGEAVPGEQLVVSQGSWNVPDLELTYQWLRDGAPISGATASAHTVVAADQGSDLAVVVTARRAGYADGSARSQPVSVPLPPEPETSSSATTAKLVRDTVRQNQRAKLKVLVSLESGEPATGPFEVRIDGTTVRTRTLRGADGGRVVVVLPRRAPGSYAVRAVYLGSSTAEPSRSEVARLVVRPRGRHVQRPVLDLARPLQPWSF